MIFGLTVLLVLCAATKASEGEAKTVKWTPMQVALWNPVQVVPDDWDVWGLGMNLFYGKNREVIGMDVGMVNSTTGFEGLQFGIVNVVDGISISPSSVSYSTSRGMEIGSINLLGGDFDGVQISAIGNFACRVRGIQASFVVNHADDMKGLQIGAVNYATTMTGVQIGIINIIDESPVSFLPLINAHF